MTKRVRCKIPTMLCGFQAETRVSAAVFSFHGLPVEASIAQSGYTLTLPLSELPKLPPRQPYPCPWLTKSDVDTYVIPLVARGWRVVPADNGPSEGVMLGKRMEFATADDLENFVERLGVLMDQAHVSEIGDQLMLTR